MMGFSMRTWLSPVCSIFPYLPNNLRPMLLAISDKPKVFGLLMPDILISDHFRVSFETVLTARKRPFYERLFHKQ